MKTPKVTLNFRTAFWGGAAILVVALLALAFRPQPELVDIATVSRGPLTVQVRDEGRTRVREAYVVSAPLNGRVLRVAVKAGDRVQAGQVVATLRANAPDLLDERSRREAEAAARSAREALSSAQADLSRADAQADQARIELERAEGLRARDAVSQEALERARLEAQVAGSGASAARANVNVRQAQLEAAQARLMTPGVGGAGATVQLRAPVSGRVLRVLQESESALAAGAPILEIGDPDDLEVVAELLSSEAVQVEEGAVADITAWGGEAVLRARVRLVEPYGFTKVSALGVEEQRVNAILDLVDPPEAWSALGHGYRVEVAVSVWQAADVVQAPVGALFREGGQWAIFKIEGGRARLTHVEIGRNDGRNAQVVSGLEPGDQVILHPGQAVSDGVRVNDRNPS